MVWWNIAISLVFLKTCLIKKILPSSLTAWIMYFTVWNSVLGYHAMHMLPFDSCHWSILFLFSCLDLRGRRIWEVHHCETNENSSCQWIWTRVRSPCVHCFLHIPLIIHSWIQCWCLDMCEGNTPFMSQDAVITGYLLVFCLWIVMSNLVLWMCDHGQRYVSSSFICLFSVRGGKK